MSVTVLRANFMRLLLGWNDSAQADLIDLYLTAAGHSVCVTTSAATFQQGLATGPYDVILLSIRLPSCQAPVPNLPLPETHSADGDASEDSRSAGSAALETAYAAFTSATEAWPETPIVGGCAQAEVFRIARFLMRGMRTYIVCDENGDFVFLVQSILESVIQGVKAEQERLLVGRLREEIDSVRKVQESIIPRDLQAIEGYTIAGRYEPSQIRIMGGKPVSLAGGDLYDVFRLDENRLVVLLGDASGHGMKACLSIMTMHTLIRMLRESSYNDTAGFVSEINDRLCEQSVVNDDGGFITLLFGVLRADTGEFTWTSAGHPPPLLQRRDDNQVVPLGGLDDGGLPLGIVPGADYESHTWQLRGPGRLLLYTDGLEEAFPAGANGNSPHVSFGVQGIQESLRKTGNCTAEEALAALFADSEAFTGGTGRHDDTSALLIDYDDVTA